MWNFKFRGRVCCRLSCAVFLTLLLLIFIPVMGQEGRITIQEGAVTIKQIFEQIERQTPYTIAYNQTKFDAGRKIQSELKNVTLDSALTLILKDTGFSWKLNGTHIMIVPGKKSVPREVDSGKKVSQTIRGVVTDRASGEPLAFVTVAVLNSDTPRGTTTDSLGRFELKSMAVGRYDLQASFVGYESAVVKEILLTSARETFCRFSIQEQFVALDEVVVQAPVNKEQTLNPMALTGGRMVSMEEAGRYAGGFDDPARLVTSFAGVAGNFTTNSIAVRGNSPQFLQWKLEGVEVPNPTHFADITGIGGGIFSALSSQVMGNSDFFNGAFPAEYSNALSGVFDMSMRTGNNEGYEHTVQVGTIGIDVASEGPLSSRHKSSYIFNYRYSTTGLVSNAVAGLNLKYQDLSFKLNFPTRRAGTFSVWGIGLKDGNAADWLENPEDWETVADRMKSSIKMLKAAGGINHRYSLKADAYIKTSLATTYAQDRMSVDLLSKTGGEVFSGGDVKRKDCNFVFSTFLNKKFGPRHTNRTGFTVTGLLYDLDYKISEEMGLEKPAESIVKGDGIAAVVSAYSNSMIRLTPRLSANVGLTAQVFTLNSHWTLEPRVALRWKVAERQSLSLAYGLHSRHERLDYYYIKTPETGDRLVNKNLDFAKAHHVVLSYGLALSQHIHLKIEPYFQYLFDVPVEPNTSFSVVNHDNWYLERRLVNEGKGRNYGIDLTLERYLNRGYYYLFTGTVFQSEYCGGDGIWRDTRMNRGYLFNALGGKEWLCGRSRQNVFSANVRFSYQGGDHYTPVDPLTSEESKDAKFDETRAFSEQFSPTLTADVNLSYRINRKRVGHEFGVKLLNVTGSSGIHGYQYNERKGYVEKLDIGGMFLPNISYKIQF